MSDLTVVLTSCRRHDLLAKTLESFFATNDYPIHEFIIIEDSDMEGVREIAARFPDQPIRVIVNGVNIGQHRSVDKAYAEVKTPYILHLEDDWQFPVSGIVGRGVDVLKRNDDLLLVLLRTDSDMPRAFRRFPMVAGDSAARLILPTAHRTWYSFTFNPTVKRLADYQKLPGGYAAFASEVALSLYYKDQGARIAWLEGTKVQHLGFGHSNFGHKKQKGFRGIVTSLQRFFSAKTLKKWRTSLGRRINHYKRKRGS